MLDIVPTVLDLASTGIERDEAPVAFDGRSLRPLLVGAAQQAHAPDAGFGSELFGRRAYRHGYWKIVYQSPPYGPGRWQLFDLARDIGERHDLSRQRPKLRNDLIRAWLAYAASHNVHLPVKTSGY